LVLPIVMNDYGNLAFVFPHVYTPVEQEVMAGQFHAPSYPGVLKKCKYEWEYTSELFYS